MTASKGDERKGGQKSREEQLAAALRANLRRRKVTGTRPVGGPPGQEKPPEGSNSARKR